MTRPAPSSAHSSRFALVAFGIPAVVTGVGTALQLLALGDLPDPIATHWGYRGTPDGFGSPLASAIACAALGLGLPALLTAVSAPGLRAGGGGPTYRLLAAMSAGTATLIVTLVTWLTLMQRGLADAHDAPQAWWPMAGSFALALVVGAVGWRVQPAVPASSDLPHPVAPVSLAPGEQVVWLQEAAIPHRWAAAGAAGTLVLLVGAVISWRVGDVATAGGLGVTALVVGALLACTTVFRVRADSAGLTVRSAVGLPRFRVRLEDIASVGVVRIEGLGDYGGWGLRWLPDRFGVVLRSGEALEIVRRSGRRFAVTVDDAATGAAVLQALLDRLDRARPVEG